MAFSFLISASPKLRYFKFFLKLKMEPIFVNKELNVQVKGWVGGGGNRAERKKNKTNFLIKSNITCANTTVNLDFFLL